MRMVVGSNGFDVEVPVLWGKRAVLQDLEGRLSVLDLSGAEARLEVLGDQPAPGATYSPLVDGFSIESADSRFRYTYMVSEKRLIDESGRLLDVQVLPDRVRVGTNEFSGNMVVGSGVGIVVQEDGGIGMGAPLPPGLAKFVIP